MTKFTVVCPDCHKERAVNRIEGTGRCRSCASILKSVQRAAMPVERFWSHVDKRGPDECWEWLRSTNKRGYGKVTIGGKDYRAHRLAYEYAIGPIPTGLHVCHSCDNPPCCNPAHLWLGTDRDNVLDMWRKGRQSNNVHHMKPVHGEESPTAILRNEDVITIRRLASDGVPKSVIARMIGASRTQVGRIVRRESWKHI